MPASNSFLNSLLLTNEQCFTHPFQAHVPHTQSKATPSQLLAIAEDTSMVRHFDTEVRRVFAMCVTSNGDVIIRYYVIQIKLKLYRKDNLTSNFFHFFQEQMSGTESKYLIYICSKLLYSKLPPLDEKR